MISTSIRRAAAKKPRANTTPHERTLWRALKELPVEGTHFRRQAPIGPYVVDFFCPAKHLIIELDGGHHNDDEAAKLCRDIARAVQEQLIYPGEVKVTVLRETRAVEFAR